MLVLKPTLQDRRTWLRRVVVSRGEDGLAEFVVCFPVFFLAVILAIQCALWSHASHLARAAAEQGALSGAAYGATTTDGTKSAYQFISTYGPGGLNQPQVTTTNTAGNMIQVTVTGTPQTLIPWMTLRVSATSVEPQQVFRVSG